jgi:ABC-type transport system involved in multi-copper enzyme maturation permease subunit
MNGMKSWAYRLSHYMTFYILYTISTIIFLISGSVARLELFTLTNTGVLVILFFIWGHVQISLAFFFSALFKKSRIALVIVFLIVLCGVIVSLVSSRLFRGQTVPTAYLIWPPFAFYRALSVLNSASLSRITKVRNEMSSPKILCFKPIFGVGVAVGMCILP